MFIISFRSIGPCVNFIVFIVLKIEVSKFDDIYIFTIFYSRSIVHKSDVNQFCDIIRHRCSANKVIELKVDQKLHMFVTEMYHEIVNGAIFPFCD